MTLVFPPASTYLLDLLQDEVRKRTLIFWLDADPKASVPSTF
ncbi:MAG: hypothetical protein R3C20_01010 [Planctomycetaceae bacterium]